MVPADRRRMGEHFVRNLLADGSQMRHRVGDVGRVPKDDGDDDEVETGRPELLSFVGAIGDSPLLERADRAGQLMALFALVEAGLAPVSVLEVDVSGLSQTRSVGRLMPWISGETARPPPRRSRRPGLGYISMACAISIDPPIFRIGQPLAFLCASSKLEASMRL